MQRDSNIELCDKVLYSALRRGGKIMKKQKKIIVSCPYCGAEIGKSLSLEHTELTCLQCRSRLTVNYKNNVLTVRETIAEYTAK